MDLDNSKHVLAQKEKKLEITKTNAKLNNKNPQTANQEITKLKHRLKGNMSLLQAKQRIRDEVMTKMKNKWDCITMMVEQKVAIKVYEFFILSGRKRVKIMLRQLRYSSNMSMKNHSVSRGP